MNKLLRWWKNRQLRLAEESFAEWKARYGVLAQADAQCKSFTFLLAMEDAAGKVAKYGRRVQLLRGGGEHS